MNYSLQRAEYNTPKIQAAIDYAAKCHQGQFRKSVDKEPFITHCLNVGNILANTNASENTVAAGILHDSIEDTFVSRKDIEQKFGKEVAELVNHVTEQDKSKSWIERSIDYIEHLKTAPANALCISAADKIDNMDSITYSLSKNYNIFQNMKGSPEMQLKKFTDVFNIVCNKIPKDLETMYKNSLDRLVAILKVNHYIK